MPMLPVCWLLLVCACNLAHNLPEGLIVGATTMAAGQTNRALLMVVAIALHNIPEGVAVCISKARQ